MAAEMAAVSVSRASTLASSDAVGSGPGSGSGMGKGVHPVTVPVPSISSTVTFPKGKFSSVSGVPRCSGTTAHPSGTGITAEVVWLSCPQLPWGLIRIIVIKSSSCKCNKIICNTRAVKINIFTDVSDSNAAFAGPICRNHRSNKCRS